MHVSTRLLALSMKWSPTRNGHPTKIFPCMGCRVGFKFGSYCMHIHPCDPYKKKHLEYPSLSSHSLSTARLSTFLSLPLPLPLPDRRSSLPLQFGHSGPNNWVYCLALWPPRDNEDIIIQVVVLDIIKILNRLDFWYGPTIERNHKKIRPPVITWKPSHLDIKGSMFHNFS